MAALETWYIGPGGSFIGLIDVLRRYGVFKEPPISRACDDAYLTCNEASKAAQAIRLDALSPEARAQYDEIIRTAVEEAAELGERLRNKMLKALEKPVLNAKDLPGADSCPEELTTYINEEDREEQ